MLTYGDDTEREAFQAAIERARKNGLSEAEMASMITAAKHDTHQTNGVHPKETDDVIYEPGELPEDLIDLPSVMREHRISRSTLHTWIKAGKLPLRGKVRAPARGGGYNVVRKDEVMSLIEGPINKGGRPRKVRK